jgi:hypothetical protein
MNAVCHCYHDFQSYRVVTGPIFIYTCIRLTGLLRNPHTSISIIALVKSSRTRTVEEKNTKIYSEILKESQEGLGVDALCVLFNSFLNL